MLIFNYYFVNISFCPNTLYYNISIYLSSISTYSCNSADTAMRW